MENRNGNNQRKVSDEGYHVNMYVPLSHLRSKGKARVYITYHWNFNKIYAHLTVQYITQLNVRISSYTIPIRCIHVLPVSLYKTSAWDLLWEFIIAHVTKLEFMHFSSKMDILAILEVHKRYFKVSSSALSYL